MGPNRDIRSEATANAGVSWSRPTFTHASLRAMSQTP